MLLLLTYASSIEVGRCFHVWCHLCIWEFFCILHHIWKGNTVYQRTIVVFFLSGATFVFIYLVQKSLTSMLFILHLFTLKKVFWNRLINIKGLEEGVVWQQAFEAYGETYCTLFYPYNLSLLEEIFITAYLFITFQQYSSYLSIHTFSMVDGMNDTVALCTCAFVFAMKTSAWKGNKVRSFRKSTRLEPFLNFWNDNKLKQCMFDINRLNYRLQISNSYQCEWWFSVWGCLQQYQFYPETQIS